MFKNYLTITLRTILKQKGYSFINVAGLTIGIVCCVLIGLFVQDELSFDSYHAKADQIYRVGVYVTVNNNKSDLATSCAPMARGLIDEFPEVIASTRLRRFGSPVVRYKDTGFSEERWFYADSTFFDVFTVPFIQGNPQNALTEPNTVVITRSMANKYFGTEEPLGKTLNLDKRRDFMVTGVVEDVPRNSHVHYDFLASLTSINDSRNQILISSNYHTYFVLQKSVPAEEFETKLQTLVKKYVHPQVKGALGITPEEFYANGGYFAYFVQRLTDIHLHSHFRFEHEPNSDITYVYIFSIIAIAILLIACINFVNLATARSANRGKEVGIRKTVGSTRIQLFRQFMAESIFMSAIAIGLALLIIEFILPYFNSFTGKQLSISYLGNIYTIPVLLGIALMVGILAGTYPAFFLASFKPVAVLKGETVRKNTNSLLRNILVVFQFTVSIILIFSTFVVYGQLNYIQNAKLGFNREQVVVVKKTDDLGAQIGAFKQELLKYPEISSITNSSSLMGEFFGDNLYGTVNKPDQEKQLIWRLFTDSGFAETYDIELAQGRYFSTELQKNDRRVVLNETAVKNLEISDPVGQNIIDMRGREYAIVGVMKDFHFQSLQQKIRPLIIHSLGPNSGGKYISARMSTDNIRETLTLLKNTWHQFAGAQTFEYEFFDDHFAKIYLAEERTGQLFFAFSLIAIFIGSLGLFGLAAFMTAQRTKEIGIRKVLGASVGGLLAMLYRQLTRWVLVANVIAWPIAFYMMNKWLQNFAFRTDITFWTFAISAALSLSIALLTVSYQAVKAAVANPVDALKYE